MRHTLKIAAIPLDITWNDKEENLFNTSKLLDRVDKNTDVIVLPELFSTGFVTDLDTLNSVAEATDGKTINLLKDKAKALNMAICGSFMHIDNDNEEEPKFHNRAFFIEPDGETTYYDKKHLFSISKEKKLLESGYKNLPIIRFRGWDIAMAVCYDLRFPVWCRRTRARSYDLLIVPANWPKEREYAWKHLLTARAIENQACVVGANRSGKDDYGEYDDTTYIFDYMGKSVGNTSKDSIIYATIDNSKQRDFREHFPVIEDSDNFAVID